MLLLRRRKGDGVVLKGRREVGERKEGRGARGCMPPRKSTPVRSSIHYLFSSILFSAPLPTSPTTYFPPVFRSLTVSHFFPLSCPSYRDFGWRFPTFISHTLTIDRNQLRHLQHSLRRGPANRSLMGRLRGEPGGVGGDVFVAWDSEFRGWGVWVFVRGGVGFRGESGL